MALRTVVLSGHLLGFHPGDVVEVDDDDDEIAALIANRLLDPIDEDGDGDGEDGQAAPSGDETAGTGGEGADAGSGAEAATDEAEGADGDKPAARRRR